MDNEKVVQLVRRLRHDFGNHLQVIMSYNDLNRPQAIKDYIFTVVEEMAAERRLFETLSPDPALYLLEQIYLAHDLGIILRYQELNINSADILRNHQEPFKSLESLSKKAIPSRDDDRIYYLSLLENEGQVKMVFASPELQTDIEVVIDAD